MRVVTLDTKEFRDICGKLAILVKTNFPSPDCIVGIRTGGEFVAKEVASYFPAATVLSVGLRRPSSEMKGGLVKRVVRILPRFMQDALRMGESLVLSRLSKGKMPDKPASLSDEVARWLLDNRHARILILDDAVDSGATLWRVKEAVCRIAPDSDIITAVITVTTSSPIITPDISLYNNRVLVRFPWAMDAK